MDDDILLEFPAIELGDPKYFVFSLLQLPTGQEARAPGS